MFIFKQGYGKGSWRGWSNLAYIDCPKCGLRSELEQKIHNDGTIAELFHCPSAICDFKDSIQLEGWES